VFPFPWGPSLNAWHLAEPAALAALMLVPLPWLTARRRRRLAWPTLNGFRDVPAGRAGLVRHLPDLLLSIAVASLCVALARPQAVGGQTRIASRGVAIVVAIDRSASMSAKDFPLTGSDKPVSRLDAAKNTLSRFIEGRPDDLIGVIAFANVPRRVSPPTLDHSFVLDAVRAIRPARAGEGGTNLGHALALGLGDLQGLTTPRRVLVLLTDGRDAPTVSDTIAPIAPEEAAELAKRLGVTLHTIAVGVPIPANLGDPKSIPVDDPGPDVERLKRLAVLGGGQAFSAGDADGLDRVFQSIDSLEKSPMVGTIHTRYREGYPVFVAVALFCLIAQRSLRATVLRVMP
jgi:Ca-activated chloride channel homolog